MAQRRRDRGESGERMIVTARLRLVPATVAHVRAEIGDRVEFARLLDAEVPGNWPPEGVADALPLFLGWLEAAPDRVGWFGWYALASNRLIQEAQLPTTIFSGLDWPAPGCSGLQENRSDTLVLVGSGGFLGPPQDGEVQIGYSVLPQFQRRRFATEMAGGLVRWALEQPDVLRIVAETEWANPASVRVLSALGFAAAGLSAEPGGMRFVLSQGAGGG